MNGQAITLTSRIQMDGWINAIHFRQLKALHREGRKEGSSSHLAAAAAAHGAWPCYAIAHPEGCCCCCHMILSLGNNLLFACFSLNISKSHTNTHTQTQWAIQLNDGITIEEAQRSCNEQTKGLLQLFATSSLLGTLLLNTQQAAASVASNQTKPIQSKPI